MRTIRTLLHQRPTAALLTLAIVFAVSQCPASAGTLAEHGLEEAANTHRQGRLGPCGKGFPEPKHRPVRLCRIPGRHRPNRRLALQWAPQREYGVIHLQH
jgi:hypothetical protein